MKCFDQVQSRGNMIRSKKVLFGVKAFMYNNYDGAIIIMNE